MWRTKPPAKSWKVLYGDVRNCWCAFIYLSLNILFSINILFYKLFGQFHFLGNFISSVQSNISLTISFLGIFHQFYFSGRFLLSAIREVTVCGFDACAFRKCVTRLGQLFLFEVFIQKNEKIGLVNVSVRWYIVSMINISISQDSPPKGSPKLHLKLKNDNIFKKVNYLG